MTKKIIYHKVLFKKYIIFVNSESHIQQYNFKRATTIYEKVSVEIMYDNHKQFKSIFVYNIKTMIMQFVPFIRKSISVIWKLIVEMKIINIYCLVLDMVNEFIDKGIQTLMLMWISYCQQKVLLYGTHVYSLDAQTMLQNTIKYLIF